MLGYLSCDISRAFNGYWHAGLHRIKSWRISGGLFGLISAFLSNSQLRLVPVNVDVPEGVILGPTLVIH